MIHFHTMCFDTLFRIVSQLQNRGSFASCADNANVGFPIPTWSCVFDRTEPPSLGTASGRICTLYLNKATGSASAPNDSTLSFT